MQLRRLFFLLLPRYYCLNQILLAELRRRYEEEIAKKIEEGGGGSSSQQAPAAGGRRRADEKMSNYDAASYYPTTRVVPCRSQCLHNTFLIISVLRRRAAAMTTGRPPFRALLRQGKAGKGCRKDLQEHTPTPRPLRQAPPTPQQQQRRHNGPTRLCPGLEVLVRCELVRPVAHPAPAGDENHPSRGEERYEERVVVRAGDHALEREAELPRGGLDGADDEVGAGGRRVLVYERPRQAHLRRARDGRATADETKRLRQASGEVRGSPGIPGFRATRSPPAPAPCASPRSPPPWHRSSPPRRPAGRRRCLEYQSPGGRGEARC